MMSEVFEFEYNVLQEMLIVKENMKRFQRSSDE